MKIKERVTALLKTRYIDMESEKYANEIDAMYQPLRDALDWACNFINKECGCDDCEMCMIGKAMGK